MGEARQHVQTLQESLTHLQLNPTLRPDKPAIRAAHTLAGISGATRVAALQPLAKAEERALERLKEADTPPRPEQRDLLVAAAHRIEAMLSEMRQGQMPLPSPELVAQLDDLGQHPSETVIPPILASAPEESIPSPKALPTSPPVSGHEGIEDDIDPLIFPIFLEEGLEQFARLDETLRQWREHPEGEDTPHAIARLLHTLKGNARMAGAMVLGQTLHTLESTLESGLKAHTPVDTLLDVLESGVDGAGQLFQRLAGGPEPEAAATDVAPGLAMALMDDTDKQGDQSANLRVRADLVDRFVNEAGEIGIARTRIDGEMRTIRRSLLDLTENVIRLRNQLRELEIQAETQIYAQNSPADLGHAGFDPLEMDRYTRLQELTRMMAESVSDVTTVQQNLLRNLDNAEAALNMQGRLTRELQQALMGVRMVPFESLADRLYRITRQTARELDKRAQLEIRGGRIEMDRSILERMIPPLEHLLRNALAHGIEPLWARETAGKPASGHITLSVSQEGNEMQIELSDDGKGLDFGRIAEKARTAGLLGENEEADENRLASLIFLPGFSTAGEVSTLSGRGVGMDVVKTAVSEVGGRIEIQSTTGKGTRFRLYLPLTLAVTQALLVRVGTRTFAIPSSMIAQVMELKPEPLSRLIEDEAISWQGQTYAYRYLPALLGDAEAQPEVQRYNWVLLLRSTSQPIALHVDGLRGNQEIVVKKAGPQLARMVGITGATVLGEGEIALIINPVALASRSLLDIQIAKGLEQALPAEPPPQIAPLVMVVDDSLTVRKITSRFLEREGFRVLTAKDGVDAIEKLLEITPDVILSDIEMPRMDGFDFLRNLRSDPRLRDIPVVMITSRLADKHRAYAEELGASHYLGKPYQEEELLGLLQRYCSLEIR
jgi:chemosensory pili system protein ChpA (sensor histidine kinase/response regulator)